MLHDKVLLQTRFYLVRRKWVRRGVQAGAAAAVFLFGGSAGWLLRSTDQPGPWPPVTAQLVVVPVAISVPVLTPSDSPDPVQAVGTLSSNEAELEAEQQDDPASAAKYYKAAGDAFLRDQDYPNATRCYRLYLTRAGATALSITPDDSWLLVSLKNAAFQEKSHVSKTDR
jgi:hypothetical protein